MNRASNCTAMASHEYSGLRAAVRSTSTPCARSWVPSTRAKFVVIDVASGDYEVSDDDDEAFGHLEEGHPEAVLFVCPRRAGADADARAEQIDEQEVGTGYTRA